MIIYEILSYIPKTKLTQIKFNTMTKIKFSFVKNGIINVNFFIK